MAGFVVTLAGIALLLGFVNASSRVVAFVPGLLLIGLGLGAMLTPSVNVVQSSFPEELQGEISGLSRSVSNLGSTFGTAIAGTILVSVVATGTRSYAVAMIVLDVFGLIGLVAACPSRQARAQESRSRQERVQGVFVAQEALTSAGFTPVRARDLGRPARSARDGWGY